MDVHPTKNVSIGIDPYPNLQQLRPWRATRLAPPCNVQSIAPWRPWARPVDKPPPGVSLGNSPAKWVGFKENNNFSMFSTHEYLGKSDSSYNFGGGSY